MARNVSRVEGLNTPGWSPDPNATSTAITAPQILENFILNSAGYLETAPGFIDIIQTTNRVVVDGNGAEITNDAGDYCLAENAVYFHPGGTVASPEFYYVSDTGQFHYVRNDAQERLVDSVLPLPSGYVFNVGDEFLDERQNQWTSFEIFELPVFNNAGANPPLTVNPGKTAMVFLPNFNDGSGTNYTVTHLGSFGAQLVAVGFNGSSRRIAFSDVSLTVGDYHTWDFGNRNTFASEVDISTYSDGEPVFGAQRNQSYFIWTTTNILRVDFGAGGQHSITVAVGDNGALSSWAVTETVNNFFCVGNNECYLFDGSSKSVVGRGLWQDEFFSRLVDVGDNKSTVVQGVYDGKGNIQLLYNLNETSKEILIVNTTLNGAATVLTGQDVHATIKFSERGVPAEPFTFDGQKDITFDEQADQSYNDIAIIAGGRFEQRILSIGGRKIYAHGLGSTYDGAAIPAFYRKEYINDKATSYGRVQIHQIVPYVEGANGSKLNIRVIGSDTPTGDIYFDTPYEFDVFNDSKADFRFASRYPGIEFSTTDAIRLYGYEVELSSLSRR